MSEIILINLTGRDRPGITRDLAAILARHGVRILDIGQAVIHDTLTLGMLIDLSAEIGLAARREGRALQGPRVGSAGALHPGRRSRIRALGRGPRSAPPHHDPDRPRSARAPSRRSRHDRDAARPEHRQHHAAFGSRISREAGPRAALLRRALAARDAGRRLGAAARAARSGPGARGRYRVPGRRRLPAQSAADRLRHGFDPDPDRGDRRARGRRRAWAARSRRSRKPR